MKAIGIEFSVTFQRIRRDLLSSICGLWTLSLVFVYGCQPTSTPLPFTASLNSDEVVPAIGISIEATGTATLIMDATAKTLSGTVRLTGVNATKVAINAGTAGKNGSEIVNLSASSPGVWVVPAGEVLTNGEITNIKRSLAYVVAYSTEYPSGEIRGQIMSTGFKQRADNLNDLFQKDVGESYGWSGGDAGMSLPLPYCASCPDGQQWRHFWMLGDSNLSTIDNQGYRKNAQGARGFDLIGGNVAAISYHNQNGSAAVEINFDWAAQGSVEVDSWMPLLNEPTEFYEMNDLRVTAMGYASLGFINEGAIARAYWSPTYAPANIRSDVVPIYETYNGLARYTRYLKQKPPRILNGFAFQRIAFYVHSTQRPGTVPLYSYQSSLLTDELLTLSSVLPGELYGQRDIVGYVFPPTTEAPGTLGLTQYYRENGYDGHHICTLVPNDFGMPIAMWPLRGVVIGDDMAYAFSPVTTINLPNMGYWRNIDTGLISIVRGVNRPYGQWGKLQNGNWTNRPEQYELPFSNFDTEWGHFFLKDDDYETNHIIYVYGHRGLNLVVAKVICETVDDLVDFANWRFYRSGSWVEGEENATSIADYAAADFTIIKSPKNRYVLTHSAYFLSPSIYFSTSQSPTGPFTVTREYNFANYENERSSYSNYIYYAANAHESLSYGAGQEGGLLVSYVRFCGNQNNNSKCDSNRADVYVPRFVNLPWSMIDP